MTIRIIAVLFSLLCALAAINVFAVMTDVKITEIHYRCSVDSYNPLYHIWFFLFESGNREFVWQEKNILNENGRYHEVIFSNKSKVVANFSSQNNEFRAMLDFDDGEWQGELAEKQVKVWFSMLDFSRRAMPGDVYETDYRTKKGEYRILITAEQFVTIFLGDKPVSALFFRGNVYKKTEKTLGVKFWISQEGEKQIVKCMVKKKFWPSVTIEAVM